MAHLRAHQSIPTRKRYSYRAAVDSWRLPDTDESDSDADVISEDLASDVFSEPLPVTHDRAPDRCVSTGGGQTGHVSGHYTHHGIELLHHHGNQANNGQLDVSPSDHSGQSASDQSGFDQNRSRPYDSAKYKTVNLRTPQSAKSMASSSSHCHREAAVLEGQGNMSDSIVANDTIHNVHMNDKICIIDMDRKGENEKNNNTYVYSTGTNAAASAVSTEKYPSVTCENNTCYSIHSGLVSAQTNTLSDSQSSSQTVLPIATVSQTSTETDGRECQILRSASTPSLRPDKTQTKLPKYRTTSTLSKTTVVRQTSSVVKRSRRLSARTNSDAHSDMVRKSGDATSGLQNPPDQSVSNAEQSNTTQHQAPVNNNNSKNNSKNNNTASGLDGSVHFVEYRQQNDENLPASSSPAEVPQDKLTGMDESAEFKQVEQSKQVSSSSRIKQVTTYGRIVYKSKTRTSQSPFTDLEGGSRTAMQRLFADRNSPKNPINPTTHYKRAKAGGRHLGQRSRSLTELLLNEQLLLMSQDLMNAAGDAAVNTKTADIDDTTQDKQHVNKESDEDLSQNEENDAANEDVATLLHNGGDDAANEDGAILLHNGETVAAIEDDAALMHSELYGGDVAANEDEAVLSQTEEDTAVNEVKSMSTSDQIKADQTDLESKHSISDGGNVTLRHCASKDLEERPKSECVTVRWDKSVKQELNQNKQTRQKRRSLRERPVSDLGDSEAISEALRKHDMKETSDRLTELGVGELMSHMCSKPRNRRMSTPHPIKTRTERTPPVKQKIHSKGSLNRKGLLNRVKSAPELDKITCKKCYSITLPEYSDHAGDLAVRKDVFSDEDSSEDTLSLGSCSVSSKITFDEMFDEETATYAEALWDHVTMDPEELPFSAHDLIEVTDMTDKDWWWGVKEECEGWFPAAFVRLRANQAETAEDLAEKMREGHLNTSHAIKRHSSFVSRDQARTNVVKEIIHAEREYVKHLKDVVEGYVEKARKRPEMFSEERISTIFGNIEEIYLFSKRFLAELEGCILNENMHLSEIGHCFVNQSKGFEIYSEYCNNHPLACKELKLLLKDSKYQHFFEACRLLQQMIQIPLEGFLLIPVQKICKYPLQLAELLKYTKKQHTDNKPVRDALHAMKQIAVLINERKRKMESVEKIALWQQTVTDWEGPDLLEKSSELIYAGDLNKINPNGWSQERSFFLFDHQLVYCKKELWRDALLYKGRIDLDKCQIMPVVNGKDVHFNVTVKHAWKIYDNVKEKWYLICAKSSTQKSRWLKAFLDERKRVNEDKKNGFNLNPSHRLLRLSGPRRRIHPAKLKGKGSSQLPLDLAAFTADSPHAALPDHHSNKNPMSRHAKKKSWFHFGGKKSKT